MPDAVNKPAPAAFRRLADVAADRLTRNKMLRRRLPGGGRIHIDRQLPFLFVCRAQEGRLSEGACRLITSEAAYLIAPSEAKLHAGVQRLCEHVIETLDEVFDAFLVIELWTGADEEIASLPEWEAPAPFFRIVTHEDVPRPLTEALEKSLREVQIGGHAARVAETKCGEVAPPNLPPLFSADEARRLKTQVLGLEISPVFRDPRTGAVYPLVLRELRPQVSRALKRTACAFAGVDSADPPEHFEALGRRALVRAVGASDRLLSKVAQAFDFLLMVTPVNAEQAWQEFQGNDFEHEPDFYYRPLPVDPDLLKRKLFNVPLENIEDPTLAYLLRKKQHELDGQITMLRERGSRRFLLTGLQVYGEVDDELLRLARRILEELLPRDATTDTESDAGGAVDARQFAARAQQEIDAYREIDSSFQAMVELTDEIPSGLMVARNRLLVSEEFHTTEDRVEALIHHEVGVHLVTAHNGAAQPFRQMRAGLAGYEPLQEGLAVLAEYLVGGLTRARMRVLAARVVAGHALVEGATFVETFRQLTDELRFTPRSAFTITMRIFRGGGLTKDTLYLKGLDALLGYLRRHEELEPLLVGKIALEDVPLVQELRRREIVHPPALQPRFLQAPAVRKRLEACHSLTTLSLLGEPPR
ncbi:MAG: flavohemoglobin expression-modulating QEGLA motif protein [Planctomycetes bacterium]|nr:flavohemoglobin expression-modulating QEGLA motif protein [Planctomycetota bacterium]